MTTFLAGPGFGGAQPGTRESAALQDIDSRTKSFVNRDFVKNIQWLNQSVDTLSAYTQKLQAGVESANQNALEQIQGFWADMFVLFAGLEPTGIDVGDVKYVLQGIGALLGINPGTPFPLNLAEAAWHLFSTYVVPLDQFTDVIFDAIFAWAAELGLSEELIDSLTELRDAIDLFTDNFDEFFGAVSQLLTAFGFPNLEGVADLWDALIGLIDGLPLETVKQILSMLADLGIPWIQTLTELVTLANNLVDLITGQFVDEGEFPYDLGDNGFDLNQGTSNQHPLFIFVQRLVSLFNIENWVTGVFSVFDVWAGIVSQFINPLGLLDEIGVPAIQSLVDFFFDAVNFGEFGQSSGNPLDSFFESALSILNIGSNAQARNVIQDAQIATLLEGGTFNIAENFDGPQMATLPSDRFDQVEDGGSGSGSCGLSGNGTMRWYRAGGVPNGFYNRYKLDKLDTHVNLVGITLMSNLPKGVLTRPFVGITAWGDELNEYWIEARWDAYSAEIGYVINRVYTRIGAAQPISGPTAGSWQLKTGTVSHAREFVLLYEGNIVLSRTDTLGEAHMVAGDTWIGCRHRCGNNPDTIFTTKQILPPEVGSLAGADRGLAT